MAEEQAQVEADALKIWGSELRQMLEMQPEEPPKEIYLSSVPPQIAVTGSLDILKDP